MVTAGKLSSLLFVLTLATSSALEARPKKQPDIFRVRIARFAEKGHQLVPDAAWLQARLGKFTKGNSSESLDRYEGKNAIHEQEFKFDGIELSIVQVPALKKTYFGHVDIERAGFEFLFGLRIGDSRARVLEIFGQPSDSYEGTISFTSADALEGPQPQFTFESDKLVKVRW